MPIDCVVLGEDQQLELSRIAQRISKPKPLTLSGCTLTLRSMPPCSVSMRRLPFHALDRLDPVLPLSPGGAERHGFEYYRHGTLSLYAALDTATGRVHGKTAARHTSRDLKEVVALCPPDQQIHIILDNLSAHKTALVRESLEQNPRVRFLGYPPAKLVKLLLRRELLDILLRSFASFWMFLSAFEDRSSLSVPRQTSFCVWLSKISTTIFPTFVTSVVVVAIPSPPRHPPPKPS
jgi:DDE superfamily endonuclease